ncbi:uncharacterized protein LOC124479089 isoform X3 [Hypomesus transpacificus]|uniref:uncharacterized protein LOC124479089 isoform X3 n=1 Tax=Hypomesus transpacificus TaxID=137520 RepID=UPI001F07ED60|nr:uncharacterized protein LOC124479089 isoform X3 [Hypomesus transpacificus]XP_046893583.1 uncharacterized protein LOC124479089 isoform X3 [Hypomesus transpacificus]
MVFLCRYLATGDSFMTISFSYRVGASTVAGVVGAVSQAIWDCLVEEFMPVPTKQDWRDIAAGFLQRWNFPNCVGSIDVQSNSDGGTLGNSAFGEALKDGTLDLLENSIIPGAEPRGPLPHVFVGDEAFPLRSNLMRPFPGTNLAREKRMFNYRLSRARLTVECAFGILSSQWRMYRRVIGVNPTKAEACVKATCVLHNFIRRSRRGATGSPAASPGQEGSAGLQEAPRLGSNNAARAAIHVRDAFTAYFNAEGAVPWQQSVQINLKKSSSSA